MLLSFLLLNVEVEAANIQLLITKRERAVSAAKKSGRQECVGCTELCEAV